MNLEQEIALLKPCWTANRTKEEAVEAYYADHPQDLESVAKYLDANPKAAAERPGLVKIVERSLQNAAARTGLGVSLAAFDPPADEPKKRKDKK